MDVRDLEFWLKEARKRIIREQRLRIQAARVAKAENSAYQGFMDELQAELRRLDIGEREAVKESWEMLMAKKKG